MKTNEPTSEEILYAVVRDRIDGALYKQASLRALYEGAKAAAPRVGNAFRHSFKVGRRGGVGLGVKFLDRSLGRILNESGRFSTFRNRYNLLKGNQDSLSGFARAAWDTPLLRYGMYGTGALGAAGAGAGLAAGFEAGRDRAADYLDDNRLSSILGLLTGRTQDNIRG